MRLLCVGDLHAGRRSSRVPAEIDGPSHACAAALDKAVDVALAEKVDAVLFAGDVVDRANRFFEAFGPLERALARLRAEAIPVVAVAGNHDFDVLSHLADSVGDERFRVLGGGGRFERTVLETKSGRLCVDGWSFPTEHVRTDPLDAYDLPPVDDAPVVGLLHADPVDPDSRYAPTTFERLESSPVHAWIVGHVHKPIWRAAHGEDAHGGPASGGAGSGGAAVLVPGSVQAIHPRERGPHGVWILEIDRAGARVEATQVPVSTVRYDRVDVDLAGVTEVQELESRVMEALRTLRDSILAEDTAGNLRYLSVTPRFVGRTVLHRSLEAEAKRLVDELELADGSVLLRIDRVYVETRPAVELDDVARGRDPAGILARAILDLEEEQGRARGRAGNGAVNGAIGGGAPRESLFDESAFDDGRLDRGSLVSSVREAAESVHRAKAYQAVSTDVPPGDGAARALAIDEGYRLLDALLAQKEARDERDAGAAAAAGGAS